MDLKFFSPVLFLFLFLTDQTYARIPLGIDTAFIKKKKFSIELELENGGILAASDIKSSTFENAYYNGLNLRLGWKSKKPTSDYDLLYNNPTYGIGIYSSTFNTDIIGSPYAVYGFVQIPFLTEKNNRIKFDYRIGLGLSGNFKPYDEDKNPLNLVIGSKNNVYIDFGIRSQYTIHPKLKAGLGLSFHHFSNGALQLPNKGINLIPVTASLTYHFQPDEFTLDKSLISPLPDNWLYHINYGIGFKQVERDSDKLYFKSTFSVYASKHTDHKWRLGGGFDIFYSSSGNSARIAGPKSGRLGAKLSGGPTFYLAHILNPRLVLNGNIGYYIHHQRFNGEIRKTFLRAGMRYYVYKNLNAGISIKAHMGKADFIEWTTGYTIGRQSTK